MRITVIGTGYVGLVQGVCLAELGHDVSCLDVDERKIELLRGGHSPVYEPGIDQLIARNIETGRLEFALPDASKTPSSSQVVFVAVGTPMSESGAADLSYVRDAVAS